MPRIAVVTGSNKGLGLGIVRLLCEHLDDGFVYLTARDVNRGKTAMANLQRVLGPNVSKLRFHQLDITDLASCQALAEHLKREHGGLDILVNNAAIATKDSDPIPFGEKVRLTCVTNYFGTRQISDVLFPLLKPGARVVNVGGRLALMFPPSAQIQAKLNSDNLTYEELDHIVNRFIQTSARNEHGAAGYPSKPLAFSKAAVLALTKLQHREAAGDKNRPGIAVNICCPGGVATDMSEGRGKPVEQAADTPVYLALLPQSGKVPSGLFFAERRVIQ